jgi:hypothetical protein
VLLNAIVGLFDALLAPIRKSKVVLDEAGHFKICWVRKFWLTLCSPENSAVNQELIEVIDRTFEHRA